jgi:hypothetical protein
MRGGHRHQETVQVHHVHLEERQVNDLLTSIPAGTRRWVYTTFSLLGVVLGAIQVAYGTATAGQPAWLTTALAVYAFVGGALGLTARANVATGPADGGEG